MFQHSRLDEIHAYTAMRLGCLPSDLQQARTVIVPAKEAFDDNLLVTTARKNPNIICLTQMPDCSVVRHHPQATDAVAAVLDSIDQSQSLKPSELLQHETVEAYDSSEPYFYLDVVNFQLLHDSHVVPLSKDTPDHRALVAAFHEHIDEKIRWFVEIDHPVVYGYQLDTQLVGISSHFLFDHDHFKIAAGGALVRPDYRKRNIGKAVVSAACQWAIDRDYIVEWSSWDKNRASIALAKSLGFQQFSTDYEFIVS